jgi:D-3-phosphoglycerate dehydrogenase
MVSLKTLLVTRRTHAAGISMLEKELEVRNLLNPSREQLLQALPGVTANIAGVSPSYDGDLFDHAPELVMVARYGVGLDNVDLDAATKRGICILYTPLAMTTGVAEHAVGLMLAAAKSFKKGDAALREGKYHTRDLLGSVDLYGKTLAVVGCGRIGSRVSQMCSRGLGMKVIVYDPYIPAEQAERAGAALRPTLDEVLSEADVVTLHTPLTDQTRHMIGEQQLALMKPTAYLINTARGPVVDQTALIAALRTGRIAAAGLDVFEPEPPSTENPLLSMPNVIVTPHAAGSSLESMQRIATTMALGILAVLHGQRPDGDCLANPEVWPRRRKLI